MTTQSPGPGASSTQLSTPDEVFEPGYRLGRYEVLRHIGAGGMGVVYQARDTVRGTVVALKTLHRMDPGALLRLKDEFRFIANVTHPNLVSLHELVSVDDRWFFTMEYVDGEDLWARLRRAVLEKANPFVQMPSNATTRVPATHEETATSVRESAQSVSDTFVGGRAQDVSATFVRGPAQEASATFVRDGGLDATATSVGASARDATVASGTSGVHPDVGDGLRSASSSDERLRPLLPPDELRRLFRQIALAIDALHSAKKLHCDIKPRNIMIGRDGRVVLLDFGLAKNRAEPAIAELAGTPAYISPEQIAGLPASEASDWYSFGATLYEALTGRRAFARDRLLKEKTLQEPPNLPPSPEIPEDLRTLCLALLQREPSQRPRGHEVLTRLGHDAGAELEPLPRAPGLVGREEHLAALWDAYTSLRTRGRTVVVHVHGLSGMGKTVLVQRFFAAMGEQRKAIVLSGRCFERESVPYKAFDSLIDSLTRYLQTLTSAQIRPLVPQHLPELLRIFPVLRQVEAFAGVEPSPMDSGRDQQELRHRAFRGLKELLLLLSRTTLLVLHIDDLQWGDQDSRLALGELLDPPGAPRLLLLCSYRTGEGEAAGLLEAHRARSAVLEEPLDVREVVLGPLSETQSRQLAALLLQADEGDARAAAIAREAHGSPFFIEELVQYLRSKGGPLASVTLEQVVLHRVAQLQEPVRRLLEVVAVAGRPVAQGLAFRAAELQGDPQSPWTVLRAGNLVRTRGAREEDPAECYHDRIRESVYAHLTPAALTAHHLRLANLLEGTDAEPEVLALHFRGAGLREKAGHYAAMAGDRAAAALAFERAAKLYREALECVPGNAALVEKQADALVNAGRCAESAPLYLEAAKSASPETAHELRRRAAEQYLSSGCIAEGVAVLKPVVDAVGLTYPASPPEALQGIIEQSIQLQTQGYTVRERTSGPAPEQLLRQVDAAWSASKGLGSVDILRGGYFSLRSTLLALEAGDPLRAARGLAALGVVMVCRAAPADVEAGNQMFAEVARILEAGKGDELLAGQYRVFRGMAEMGLGHWRRSDQLLMEGNHLLEERCTGCAWELSQGHVCDVYSLIQLGELREAASRGSRWLRGAQEIGDLYGRTSLEIHMTVPTLAADQVEAATAQLQETVSGWSKEQFTPQHLLALTDATKAELYRGNAAAAWNLLDGAWKAAEHSMGWQFTRVMAFYFHAGAAVALARQQPSERERLLAIAKQEAQVVHQEGRHYARGVAGILRAGVAMTEGQPEAALRELEEAIAGFSEAEMSLHAACARRRKGEVLGGDRGLALIAEADSVLESQGVRKPQQWADMYAPGFRGS